MTGILVRHGKKKVSQHRSIQGGYTDDNGIERIDKRVYRDWRSMHAFNANKERVFVGSR